MTITDVRRTRAATRRTGPVGRLVGAVAAHFPGCEDAVVDYLTCGDAADTERLTETHAVALVAAQLRLGAVRCAAADLIEVDGRAVRIVTDAVPGLTDAVTTVLTTAGLAIRRLFHVHFPAVRDPSGALVALFGSDTTSELWLQAELGEPIADPDAVAAVLAEAVATLRLAAADAEELRRALLTATRRVLATDVLLPGTRLALQQLHWLAEGTFEPLGYAEYSLADDGSGGAGRLRATPLPGTALGVLRDAEDAFFAAPRPGDEQVLLITKDVRRAPTGRGLCDYVGVRLRDASGRLTTELRFIGRFTARADATGPFDIPGVRERARAALAWVRSDADAAHGERLTRLLDACPRDELLGGTADELASVLGGIAELQERRQVRLFIRPDAYGRFLACQVYLPRPWCTPEAVQRVRTTLLEAVEGALLAEETWTDASALARLYLVIRPADPVWQLDLDLGELQDAVASTVASWDERFERHRPAQATGLVVDFGDDYRRASSPCEAASDLRAALAVLTGGWAVRLGPDGTSGLKLFTTASVSVSRLVRVLDGLGVDVLDHQQFRWRLGGRLVQVYALRTERVGGDTLAGIPECLGSALTLTAADG